MRQLLVIASMIVACGAESADVPAQAPPWSSDSPYEAERQQNTGRRPFVETPAGLDFPPDEYEVPIGQWGLDIDESLTVVRTGVRSMWFKATSAAAAQLQLDADHVVSIEAGRRYKPWAVFQGDSTDGGHKAEFFVDWLRADRATLVSTSTVYSNPVTTKDAWQRAELLVTAPSGAHYLRLRFGRSGSFNCYFDEVNVNEAVPMWHATLPFDDTHPGDNSTEDAPFNTLVDSADVTFNATTGEATIIVPGWYNIETLVQAFDLVDGADTEIHLRKNGSIIGYGGVQAVYAPGGGTTGEAFLAVQRLVELAAGDVVKVTLRFDNSSSLVQLSSGFKPYFSAVRVM